MYYPKYTLAFMAALALLTLNFGPIALASEASSVISAVENAENMIASAYHAIVEAENAGADVSDLAGQLSVAGDLLAQAYVEYIVGNFSGAVCLANLCYEVGDGVEAKAQRLKDLAVVEGVRRFWLTIVGWVVSLVVIVCASFLGWRVFKRRYYQKILRMKPEVGSGKS